MAGERGAALPGALRRVDLLFALPEERAPLLRRLASAGGAPPAGEAALLRCRRARLGALELRLAVSGIGARRAARAAEALLATDPPELLLVAGVAGALAPELSIGEIVVATAVCAGAEALPAPEGPLAALERIAPGGGGARSGWRKGALLSTDRILVSPAEKRAAARAAGAPLAVEMETAAVARIAAARGCLWAAARAVSDGAEEALPLDFEALRGPDGDLSPARVAAGALLRPAAIPGLVRLARNTRRAAEALAAFLPEWLAALAAGAAAGPAGGRPSHG